MKVKEESQKAGLKLNIQKTEIMAFSPTLHGKQMGETMESMTDCLLGLQKSLWMVTAAVKLKDLFSLEGKL